MPRVEVALSVRVCGALSVGGLARGETLADRHVVRDAWGRLLLPGSHVKGRLRHACEQVARALGQPVCRAPRAERMCPQAADVPSPPCIVCTLFGSPAWRSPLRWRDLPCVDELGPSLLTPEMPAAGRTDGTATQAPIFLRPGVALNRRRGTAEEGRLFFLETSPPLPTSGLRFAGERAIVGQLSDSDAVQWLLAACRLVASFGGGETRGLGWSEVTAAARLDGAAVGYRGPKA